MVLRNAVALVLAAGIGVVSFLFLDAWTAAVFDGRARTIILPFLVLSSAAVAAAGVLTQRVQGHWWPGPVVVAVAWFVQWQYLLARSLAVHG